jgi:hypothetical protein
MQRIAPVIAAVTVGGLAVVALSACAHSVGGAGQAAPAAYHAGAVVPPVSSASPTTQATATATSASTSDSATVVHGTSSSAGGGAVPTNTVTATATCVVADHEDLPGMPNTPLYQPKLTWHVTHATGMALSVDNPGIVGSYGTYAAQGTLMLGGGCYTDEGGSTTITFYSVGGAGPRAHRTIVLNPTLRRPTAPPLADQTPTTTPNP